MTLGLIAALCGYEQRGSRIRAELQGIRQQPHRARPRRSLEAAFQIADRARAHSSTLGKLLLGQPLCEPVLPEQACERRCGHGETASILAAPRVPLTGS